MPIWTGQGKVTPQALRVIEALQNANAKGLDAEDYDASRWTDRVAVFQPSSSRPSETDVARFDLALTVSAMRYVSDLNTGRVNPRLCDLGFDIEDRRLDLSAFLQERIVNANAVSEALASVEPRLPGYRRLGKALQRISGPCAGRRS
jgi:murein L,D-transpeptidase YcbB/YkuD